jgi:hypothetical protein
LFNLRIILINKSDTDLIKQNNENQINEQNAEIEKLNKLLKQFDTKNKKLEA